MARLANRILIVDDDPLMASLLTHVLAAAGYDVRQAANAEDALNMIAVQEPHIALLDIQMPGMSGIELAGRLNTETSVPFMFLSASKDNDIVRRAVEHGAVGYLVKPIDADNLIPAVEAGLARAQEIRHLRRTEANLTAALAAGRETNIAVGVLMARFRTDRNCAFEVMRDYARANRRKLNEVADELIRAEETLNRFQALFAKRNNNAGT
jgi:response regulator NasT